MEINGTNFRLFDIYCILYSFYTNLPFFPLKGNLIPFFLQRIVRKFRTFKRFAAISVISKQFQFWNFHFLPHMVNTGYQIFPNLVRAVRNGSFWERNFFHFFQKIPEMVINDRPNFGNFGVSCENWKLYPGNKIQIRKKIPEMVNKGNHILEEMEGAVKYGSCWNSVTSKRFQFVNKRTFKLEENVIDFPRVP